MHRLVAVAVDQHHLARLQQRHEHGLVRGRGAVRHIAAQGAAEYLRRQLLRLRQRRLRLRARKVAERLHRHRKVGAEYHRAERLVEPPQERRVGERLAAVVPGSMPVRPGLDLHVLPHGACEPRQPERLEEMDDALAVGVGAGQDLYPLLRPASLRHDDRRTSRIDDGDLRKRGDVGLEPVLQRHAADVLGIEAVVHHEQTDVVAALGHAVRRVAVDEKRIRDRLGRRHSLQLEGRVFKRYADVECLGAEIAEGVRQAVFGDRKHVAVARVRLMQPKYGKCSHLVVASLPLP